MCPVSDSRNIATSPSAARCRDKEGMRSIKEMYAVKQRQVSRLEREN
jgi:hypothetical protein